MPTDPATGKMEADVIINGKLLTLDECRAVRMAVEATSQVHRALGLQQPGGPWSAQVAALERVRRLILERSS